MLEVIGGLLPQHAGLLPKWMLFVRRPSHLQTRYQTYQIQLSVVSVGSTVQCYRTTKLANQMYNADSQKLALEKPRSVPQSDPQVTALSARTFGTWTLITSILRCYAAYNISNPAMYQLAFASYLVAFSHFASEWLVFKTARWNSTFASPFLISTGTMVWMLSQWRSYVQ